MQQGEREPAAAQVLVDLAMVAGVAHRGVRVGADDRHLDDVPDARLAGRVVETALP
jgi:hypothetical protein